MRDLLMQVIFKNHKKQQNIDVFTKGIKSGYSFWNCQIDLVETVEVHIEVDTKTKLLVLTGEPVENGIKTEMIDLKNAANTCTGPDFPVPLMYSNGGLLNDEIPIICGGQSEANSVDSCRILENGKFHSKGK